jgi:hypothetical protein
MRFVVLFHHTPPGYPRGSHWDFMLEIPGGLRTWALPAEPSAGADLIAQPLADHRLEYLTFEGPLSGGRGSVARWDAGTYETLDEADGRWVVRLAGSRLAGVASLQRLDAQRWRVGFSGGVAISG